MSLRTMVEETAEAGLRRGTQGDVIAMNGRETVTGLAAARPDAVREISGLSACLRARADGRVGSLSTTSLDDPGQLWDRARELSRYGPPDPGAVPAAAVSAGAVPPGGVPPAAPTEPVPPSDPLPHRESGVDLETLQRRTGLQVHGTVRTFHRDVASAELGGPVHVRHEQFMHADLVLEGGSGGDYDLTWTHWEHQLPDGGDVPVRLDADALAWFAWAAQWQDRPERPAPSGLVTLVLTPAAVHAALSPLVSALNGAEMLAGRSSRPADWTGEAVLHPALELWDGGGPVPVDDEGTATGPLRLVAGGRPQSGYHSRHTATALGTAPTGHGRRGTMLRTALDKPVRPVLSDVRITLAGSGSGSVRQAPWPDLVAGVRRGILVDSLLGAGQARQGGTAQQRLEGRVRMGWVLESGRVTGRLEPVAVSIPLSEVLAAGLRAISAQTWAAGRDWTGRLPFIVVSGLRLD